MSMFVLTTVVMMVWRGGMLEHCEIDNRFDHNISE